MTGTNLMPGRPGMAPPGRPARARGAGVRTAGAAGAACLVALTLLSGAPGAAGAADPAAGHAKARQCQTCHGLDGVGRMPDVPNIAGESTIYLTRQLRAFRSGERRHEQMSIIASTLSDEDIADLAAYYASIEFSVQVPEY